MNLRVPRQNTKFYPRQFFCPYGMYTLTSSNLLIGKSWVTKGSVNILQRCVAYNICHIHTKQHYTCTIKTTGSYNYVYCQTETILQLNFINQEWARNTIMQLVHVCNHTYKPFETILSISLQVWKIFRPWTVLRVIERNTTSSNGRSMWIGACETEK